MLTALQYTPFGKNVNEFNRVLNNDPCNVSNWLARNKLSLNFSKTELIIIGS